MTCEHYKDEGQWLAITIFADANMVKRWCHADIKKPRGLHNDRFMNTEVEERKLESAQKYTIIT